MANIVVGRVRWVAVGDATFLQPGVSHNWIWGLGNLNEAITFTALPLAAFLKGVIIVEDLKISLAFPVHLAEFRVRNVGGTPIKEYMVTGSFIS